MTANPTSLGGNERSETGDPGEPNPSRALRRGVRGRVAG
jgi:hypothetical protein